MAAAADLHRVPSHLRPGRAAMFSRILWVLSVTFALISASMYAWHLANHRLFDRFVARADAGREFTPADRFAYYVHYVARTIHDPAREQLPPLVRLYYDVNPLHPGAGDVIRWGSEYRGPCGSHSAVLVAMLKTHRMEARPLFLVDDRGRSVHTVVEARIGGRWVVGDPSYDVVYHRRDGMLAGKEELAADRALFRANVAGVAGYPGLYDYDAWTLLNWEKLPVVLPAIRATAVRAFGEDRVRELTRPAIWMMPRRFYSSVFGLCSLACACIAWTLGRRRRSGSDRSRMPSSGSGWAPGTSESTP
jgi:hypothetical protein